MAIKRGVSLYSYQQSQYLKDLNLEEQIAEVTSNLEGADGIEIIDEMSLRYPNPSDEFISNWFKWLDKYGAKAVTMDVGMDVLQFRDHVMSHEECAERLKQDIKLAKKLGFSNVRVLSTTPLEVILMALPTAEKLDIRLGREIHQPMHLQGRQVIEIFEHVEKTGTKHLGVVPDFGIFQFRPSDVLLEWFIRKGATEDATKASIELCTLLDSGKAPFNPIDTAFITAGNLRADFKRFLVTGDCGQDIKETFEGVVNYAKDNLENPSQLDQIVVAEALMLSRTSAELMRPLVPIIISIHGKFNNMSEIPGQPGKYQDVSIDYVKPLKVLREENYQGYLNSEYEGQRYFQDRGREFIKSEVEQVRRHHEMLRRLMA